MINKKFFYYKETKFGQTVRLHLHEYREDLVIGKTFPESEDMFDNRDLIQLDTVDDFLDCAIENKIFDSKPIPNSSSSS